MIELVRLVFLRTGHYLILFGVNVERLPFRAINIEIMRISFVIPDVTRNYGTERTTSLLANTFAAHGHEVSILSVFKEKKSLSFPLDDRVCVYYLVPERYTHRVSWWSIFRQYARAIIAIRRYYREHPVDVIIGQSFLSCFFLWMSGNARKAFACEHYKYGVYNRPIRAFRNWMYRRFRQVVVLTENDAREYQSRQISVSVIPNMLSFPIADFHQLDNKRMISVGRLHPQKGYDLLLRALVPVFKKYPDWRIDIYGEGDDRPILERLREDLELMRYVRFVGFSSDIRKEYLRSSFYVMSSRFEGFPMVLLEAIACGLPVVSFDCPSGPSALLKGEAGLLVEPENIAALSAAIIRMIEKPELREAYARKGREAALAYTPDAICRKWELLF